MPEPHPGSASQKLFIVTRKDLSPGQQIAQACHAMAKYAIVYPDLLVKWHFSSDYLVVLSVVEEADLCAIFNVMEQENQPVVMIREPDLGTKVTAVACGPGRKAFRALRCIPLALSELSPLFVRNSDQEV